MEESLGEVIDLNARQPHITVFTADGNAHVLPAKIIEDIVNGTTPPSHLLCIDDGAAILRGILSEWYEGVKGCSE